MTNPDVLDTLTRLAGGRGALSGAELRQVVPVESMSVEDIAALIAELEERGITVDIDPALLSPRRPVSPETRAAAAGRPRAERPPPVAPLRPAAETSGSAAASSPSARASTATQPSQRTVTIVVLAAAAVVVTVLVALTWAF